MGVDGHQHVTPAVGDGAGGADALEDGMQCTVAMWERALAAVAYAGGQHPQLALEQAYGGSPSMPAAWLSIWWMAVAMSWTEWQAEVQLPLRRGCRGGPLGVPLRRGCRGGPLGGRQQGIHLGLEIGSGAHKQCLGMPKSTPNLLAFYQMGRHPLQIQ
jgi:hypothetical protein